MYAVLWAVVIRITKYRNEHRTRTIRNRVSRIDPKERGITCKVCFLTLCVTHRMGSTECPHLIWSCFFDFAHFFSLIDLKKLTRNFVRLRRKRSSANTTPPLWLYFITTSPCLKPCFHFHRPLPRAVVRSFPSWVKTRFWSLDQAWLVTFSISAKMYVIRSQTHPPGRYQIPEARHSYYNRRQHLHHRSCLAKTGRSHHSWHVRNCFRTDSMEWHWWSQWSNSWSSRSIRRLVGWSISRSSSYLLQSPSSLLVLVSNHLVVFCFMVPLVLEKRC